MEKEAGEIGRARLYLALRDHVKELHFCSRSRKKALEGGG